MSEVKRYTNELRNFCCGHMVCVLDGDYVASSDYDALSTHLSAAQSRVKELEAALREADTVIEDWTEILRSGSFKSSIIDGDVVRDRIAALASPPAETRDTRDTRATTQDGVP